MIMQKSEIKLKKKNVHMKKEKEKYIVYKKLLFTRRDTATSESTTICCFFSASRGQLDLQTRSMQMASIAFL